VTVNPAGTTQDCSRCGCRVPKTLADRVLKCPKCGLLLCRDTNAARNIEQRAFGKGSVYGEIIISNTAGTVYPELVPVSPGQTPVETGSSAAPALTVSPVVEAWKPPLKPHSVVGSSQNVPSCFAFLLLSTLFILSLGCKDKESYKNEITSKGIPYSTDSFLNEAGVGNKERIELFIKAGMNVNAKNNNGDTALMRASADDNFEVVKLLIEKGADVNAKDNDGYTVLMVASSKADLAVATLLIKKGADVNASNNAAETALMLASLNGNFDMAQLLIEKGADVNAKSNNGKTALKYSFLDTRMSELLRKAGAKE